MWIQYKCFKIKNKFFLSALLFLHLNVVFAKEYYIDLIKPGSKIVFKHWDSNQSKITGYSYFSYEKIFKDGKYFFLEKNKNTKPDGKVFTKKTLWFESSSGMIKNYEEEDFRKNYSIKNYYKKGKIITNLKKTGKILDFETDIGSENVVPLEIFFFFLRKNYNKILKSENFSFTLFIPLLAIELEEKGLPRSMSMIQMIIEFGKNNIQNTILGKIEARKFLVFPKSSLLRALLPKEKTNFEFLIANEFPHDILEFKVGKTKHILSKLIFKE